MSNKGLKIQRWRFMTLDKNAKFMERIVRAYTEANAKKSMEKWAKEDGFTVIEFIGEERWQ